MRSYILMRDKYRCTMCGGADALEVHHIKHLSPENINDAMVTLNDANLTTLCRDCHFKVHERDKVFGSQQYAEKHSAGDCDADFRFDENGYLVPVEK